MNNPLPRTTCRASADSASSARPITLAARKGGWHTLPAVLPIIVLCVATGGAIAGSHQLLLVALAAIVLLGVFAWAYPGLFGIALVAMLLVPYTWSPTIRTAPTPLIVLFALPGAFAAAVALTFNGRLRLCVLDYLVIAILISLLSSEYATVAGGILGTHSLAHIEVEVLLIPYLAFRLIFTAWPQTLPKLLGALMMTGAALSLFAVYEELHRSTPFATSSLNNPLLVQWERNYPRAGGVRAQAVMGHPIALGSFLVIPLVFAFAQRRWRLFGVLALGEALTLSRGPYIAAIAALLLYSILTRRVGRFGVLIAVAGVLALFIGPVRNSVTNSFQTGTAENANAHYRSALLSTSIDSLTLWGKPAGETTELYSGSQTNLSDVTSELALISGRQGVSGLLIWLGFLAAFAYIIREAKTRSDSILMLLGTALVGEWVALLSVALITTFQDAFWLTAAMAAARLTQGISQPDKRSPTAVALGRLNGTEEKPGAVAIALPG
jgi:hypothetical protein